MKLPGDLGHLTYCLNIHPSETWQEVRTAIAGSVPTVKAAVSPDRPFMTGLRFSAVALADLADPAARAELKGILDEADLLPLSVNGFPYGPFHGTRVKEDVYQPDWRTEERVRYTNDLADLMAELNPEGADISLSTVPGTFKPLGSGAESLMAANYVRSAAHCHALAERTGRIVRIAIEPEPFCFLETITETVAFFERHLYGDAAVASMAGHTGLAPAAAVDALRRHLGVCYDVCHAAVEYEDPAGSIAALRAAGIPVYKLQLSAALLIPSIGAASRARLAEFSEPTYLHQVIARRGKTLTAFPDLPEALARTDSDGEEWRVHFHVPLFVDEIPPFRSTQGFLAEILALHRADPISGHLEVETYTWGVLPNDLRSDTIENDIARDLGWVLARLSA